MTTLPAVHNTCPKIYMFLGHLRETSQRANCICRAAHKWRWTASGQTPARSPKNSGRRR